MPKARKNVRKGVEKISERAASTPYGGLAQRASNAVKECTICKDDFDENERCPRILPCTHTICTQCITELIRRNNKTCPFCRQTFRTNSAKELKVNAMALDFLKYIKTMESKSSLTGNTSLKTHLKKAEELRKKIRDVNNQNIISLQTAKEKLEEAIDSNETIKEQIFVNHSQLKYEITSKLMGLEKSFNMEMNYLEKENAKLQKLLEGIEEQMNNLDEAKSKLEVSGKLNQIGEGIEQAEASNDEAQSWLQNYSSLIARDEMAQKGLKENIKKIQAKINSLRKILDSSENEDKPLFEHVAVTLLLEPDEGESVERMNPIKMSFPKLDEIMAVQTIDGKTRYAKFSIYENKLCLHSLRDIQQIPTNVYIIQHSDVVKRFVDPSFRTSFMDLGIQDSIIGRILIRLTPDTKRANNFFLLSSAESGPNSYLNTALFHVDYKGQPGECVRGGDYEYNNGNGGKGVVEGAGEERGGVLHRPDLAGSVSGYSLDGDESSSLFLITTRDDLPGVSYDTVFGQVESGLNILREAIANYPNIKDVQIIDCGIVLDL